MTYPPGDFKAMSRNNVIPCFRGVVEIFFTCANLTPPNKWVQYEICKFQGFPGESAGIQPCNTLLCYLCWDETVKKCWKITQFTWGLVSHWVPNLNWRWLVYLEYYNPCMRVYSIYTCMYLYIDPYPPTNQLDNENYNLHKCWSPCNFIRWICSGLLHARPKYIHIWRCHVWSLYYFLV